MASVSKALHKEQQMNWRRLASAGANCLQVPCAGSCQPQAACVWSACVA